MTQQDVGKNKNTAESDLKFTAKLRFQMLQWPVLYIMTGDFDLKCYNSVDVKRFVLGNKNP